MNGHFKRAVFSRPLLDKLIQVFLKQENDHDDDKLEEEIKLEALNLIVYKAFSLVSRAESEAIVLKLKRIGPSEFKYFCKKLLASQQKTNCPYLPLDTFKSNEYLEYMTYLYGSQESNSNVLLKKSFLEGVFTANNSLAFNVKQFMADGDGPLRSLDFSVAYYNNQQEHLIDFIKVWFYFIFNCEDNYHYFD